MDNSQVTGMLAALRRQDEKALHLMVAGRRRLLDAIMRLVTELGDTRTVAGLVLALWAHEEGLGTIAAFALLSSHLLVQLLKRTVNRSRPCLPAGTACLLEAPDRFSFPSGHAAASLSLALTFATALPPAASLLVVGLALLTGISRAYLGVHYPGDVVAGWVVAWACWSVSEPAVHLITGS